MAFFYRYRKNLKIPKFIWNTKDPKNQNNLEKKNEDGVIIIPDFKTCFIAKLIKIVQYWHKHRRV